jgi:hypothetical protein
MVRAECLPVSLKVLGNPCACVEFTPCIRVFRSKLDWHDGSTYAAMRGRGAKPSIMTQLAEQSSGRGRGSNSPIVPKHFIDSMGERVLRQHALAGSERDFLGVIRVAKEKADFF